MPNERPVADYFRRPNQPHKLPSCSFVLGTTKSVSVLQVFFVIRLQSSNASLPAIRDPDPLVTSDLMDGRDAFLMSAREKHYEFSTLRRAKFSSMAMLFELHTQGRDNFVYTCNACKANMETHYHCSTCDVRSPMCSSPTADSSPTSDCPHQAPCVVVKCQ